MPKAVTLCIMTIATVCSAGEVYGYACPGLGAPLVLDRSGDVEVWFVRGTTARNSRYALESPANSLGTIWEDTAGQTSPVFSVGFFPAGTELVFMYQTFKPNFYTYEAWYSGPASRNSDNTAHACVTRSADGVWRAAWESDVFGGDSDYDDGYTYVRIVPEPATLLLICIGAMVGLGPGRGSRQRV